MTESMIIQTVAGVLCLIALIFMAIARKDASCNPKSCINCKHHALRRIRLSCEECIRSRELPGWEKNDD